MTRRANPIAASLNNSVEGDNIFFLSLFIKFYGLELTIFFFHKGKEAVFFFLILLFLQIYSD